MHVVGMFAKAFLIALVSLAGATAQNDKGSATAQWFASGSIPELRIEIDDAARGKLRREPRRYVKARFREGKHAALDVGIKLKGSAGSFQRLRDKPGLTIDFDRYQAKATFHGLAKFHLNNAAQDASYLREDLAYELFRRAGLPAPRITHARVRLGDRDMGLYVLKESYDVRFVETRFAKAQVLGNLYDGGVNGEVHDELDRDVGHGEIDYKDLKALAAACELPPGEQRREQLRASLDVDQFVTFMAAEVMIGHWDGYTLNPNNYRIYFGPDGRAVFLVHGTDQTFQHPHAEIFPDPKGRVAKRVLAEQVWRDAYKKRVRELLPLFAPADALLQRIRSRAARLEPVVKATMSEDFYDEWQQHCERLERDIVERGKYLSEASRGGWPEVLAIPVGGALLGILPWHTQTDCDDVKLAGNGAPMNKPFTIEAAGCGRCIGSWRTSVLLNRGRYEFRAVMTTKDVEQADDYNPGAGIRISGGKRASVAEGTATNKPVMFAFEINGDHEEVVLVMELRAGKGSVSFDKKSLRLVRVE